MIGTIDTVKMIYNFADGSEVVVVDKKDKVETSLLDMIDMFQRFLNGLGYDRDKVDSLNYEEWYNIRRKERPDDEKVLVTTTDGKVLIADYDSEKQKFSVDNVYSWTYLPKPDEKALRSMSI